MSIFEQEEIIHHILLFVHHRDWKCCFPFVISSSFYQVISSESFASDYYANFKSLSSSQSNDLKEKISRHSIYYIQREEKLGNESKKRKTLNKPFWNLLKECILDLIFNHSQFSTNDYEFYSKSRFGSMDNLTKNNIDIKKRFSELLEKDFLLKKHEDDTGLIIKSKYVKKLLELEKLDIQVHKLNFNRSVYFNSSSDNFNIDYTIYIDCGYPIHINTKVIDLSVRSGNYRETALSTTINDSLLFEWNYNEDFCPVKFINTNLLTGLSEDIFKEKGDLWHEIEQDIGNSFDSRQTIFDHLFLKFIDPCNYFSRFRFDEEFLLSNITTVLPYYFSEWVKRKNHL